MFDELLEKAGITREKMNAEELETLERWAKQLSVKQLTPVEVKDYINQMIVAVEKELTGYQNPESFVAWLFRGKRMVYLNARLYNYLMLRDFLTAPEKARAFVEKHITNLK